MKKPIRFSRNIVLKGNTKDLEEIILKNPGRIEISRVRDMCEHNRLDMIKFLFENNHKYYIKPILITCLQYKRIDIIKYLIEVQQIDPNFKDRMDQTILYDYEDGNKWCGYFPEGVGYENEHLDYLIEKGLDINSKDKKGMTVLMRYTELNYLDKMEYLLKKNAKPDLKDNFGNTAMHYACLHLREEAVNLLLKYGANIDVQNNTGMTPLMKSCIKYCPGFAKFMISKGANINKRTKKGETAYDLMDYEPLKPNFYVI